MFERVVMEEAALANKNLKEIEERHQIELKELKMSHEDAVKKSESHHEIKVRVFV